MTGVLILTPIFRREEQIFTLKSELAVKNQELSEIRSNLSRLDHQSRTTVEQKLNVSSIEII